MATGGRKKISDREKSGDIFWADRIAADLLHRCGSPAVKAGASPSGAKHIGNLFDVLKGYMVYRALRRKGADATFILTHDDRDPLRTVPARLPTLDAEWIIVEGEMKNDMEKYFGCPYSDIPDPFGCCETWSLHFSKVWEDGILASGVKENEIKFIYNNDLYNEGAFNKYIRIVFANLKKVRTLMAQFQKSVAEDYVPLLAICENCGKIIGKVETFDLSNQTVGYRCESRTLAGKYRVGGCGFAGEQPWGKCKLVWRFEWPAQWGIFNVDFEAFGKDHAEGSWPSGRIIAKEIYGMEPPLPHVYEFLLVNGEKMSARRGNVFITQEILRIIEPEIFMYFYTKRSGKQRDLDLKNISRLADEFERVERIYFGLEKESSEQRLATIRREYESAMGSIPQKPPLRVEYQFASVIAQLAPDLHSAIRMLQDSGHIKGHISEEEKNAIAMRLSLAKNWVQRFAPERAVAISTEPKHEILQRLSENQKSALAALAESLKKPLAQDKLQNSFYEIAKKANITSQDFFRAAYLVLIGRESGPRLAPFVLALGQGRVREVLGKVK